MKHNWTYKKLGEVCNVSAGQGAPQGDENYCTEGTPFVKAGNIEDLLNGLDENCIQKVTESVAKSHKLKLYKAGSVVFAKSGMSCMKGLVYTLKQDCHVVSHLAVLTPKEVNSSFLNYALKYFKPNKLVKDEAYPSISLSDISNFSIPIPPIEPQSRIVSELDLLQSIIDKQKSQLKELDNLAQAIFYDMFGDPVENEKGWEVKQLSKVCSLKAGKAIKAAELLKQPSSSNYPCYGGNGIRGYINKLSHNKTLPIIGRQGALCGNVNLAIAPFYATEHAVVVTPIIDIDVIWLYYQLSLMKLNQYAHGVAQPGLAVQDIEPLYISLPPLPLQQAFAEKIESIERQKELINQSIREAQTLFDSRMEYYFGE